MPKIYNIGIISLNKPGFLSSLKLINDLFMVNPEFKITIYTKYDYDQPIPENIIVEKFTEFDQAIYKSWQTCKAIIWFTSTGIVIRKIAKLLDDKLNDPAILVINLSLTQIIPLLSGHIGGSNELATKLANVNKNFSVFITTATDSTKTFAIDLFCKKYNLFIENIEKVANISNQILNDRKINLISHNSIADLIINEGLNSQLINQLNLSNQENADNSTQNVIIATKEYNRITNIKYNALKISIEKVSIGIGLNKETPYQELKDDFYCFIKENYIFIDDIEFLCSFEAKKNDQSLKKLALEINKSIIFYNKSDITSISSNYIFSKSEAEKHFDIPGVAEPCSVLASQNKTLLIPKVKFKNTTFAASF